METLDAEGHLDDTHVIFMSDNGWMWGEHRRRGKVVPYEESIRVPLMIRPAGALASGLTIDELVISEDVVATIVTMARVSVPPAFEAMLEGTPLTQLTNSNWREEILLHAWPDVVSFFPIHYFGVRTNSWKFVEYETGEEELYDLVNDPYELDNLAANPSFAADRDAMATRLYTLRPLPTLSVTPTAIPTITSTATATATPTVTPIVTVTPTSTVTPTVTATPIITPTATALPTITPTVIVTPTTTATSAPTVTPTTTITATPTSSPTVAPSVEPTWTPTLMPSSTPTLPATATATATLYATETPTVSATP